MLGKQGLLKIVSDLNPDEPDRLIPRLLRSIESRYDGNLSEDDTTLLCGKRPARAAAWWIISMRR